MQTYEQLQQDLNFELALPVTPDWSAAADFLHLIKDHCIAKKPETIVECSSGLSTLILAGCCQKNNSGHVYSLENGEQYQHKTLQQLKQFQLQNYADVFYAPLINYKINHRQYDWYQYDSVSKLEIDMLVIDGPPGFIQKHSRLPALPLLFRQLQDGACVFLDDAGRDEEKQIIKMWLEQFPALSHEYIDTDRGCSILKMSNDV